MTKLEQAIRDAEKGGYNAAHVLGYLVGIRLDDERAFRRAYVLDPLWWQALGKARGWVESWDLGVGQTRPGAGWNWHWHSFIDHLAAGKDIESFFETL